MKAIVVYFSFEGNTQHVAEKVAQYLEADTLGLEPVKAYPHGKISKFIWGGKSVLSGEKPKLRQYDFSASDYDLIIIGTPVWAGSFTPPIKTFISENNLTKKKIALYACHSGGGAQKCFDNLKNELKACDIIAALNLNCRDTAQLNENAQKIKEFCDNIILEG